MSPKTKDNHFPSIRITEELREQTERAIKIVDEGLSEYIRQSVKEKNERIMRKKGKEG